MVAVVTAAAVGPPRPIAITTYADLPGHHHSAAFTGMSVGGTPVNIREYKGYGYVRLATSGAAAVLTAAASVTSCEVYPRAHGIATTTRGHTCSFPVLAAKQLEVRVNSRERLFVFVDPPEPAAPPCCDGVSVFDVTTYPKVDPTGRTKSTGIQEAIIDVARRARAPTPTRARSISGMGPILPGSCSSGAGSGSISRAARTQGLDQSIGL